MASSLALCSRHAARRAQQRALPPDLLDLLLDHGDRFAAGGGAAIVRVSNRTRRELAAELPGCDRRQMEKLRTAYAVEAGDGVVITVGHRFRRVERR